MKTMSCKQLGGACELSFQAESFEAMAQQAQQHGREMFEQQEPAHLALMAQMQVLMQDPTKMQAWLDRKRAEFEALPED